MVQTGVGTLPVPSRLAAQMHTLFHNARGRKHLGSKCSISGAAVTSEKFENPPKTPQEPGSAPLPPPSGRFQDLEKQWERLLTWATLRTLQDYDVMPARPAREVSRRLARRILADYGPSLHKWLGQRVPGSTRFGGNTT